MIYNSAGLATPGTHATIIPASGINVLLYSLNNNGVRNWSTYFGGPGVDRGFAIKCNSLGQIYVGGYTESSSGIATAGSHKTTLQLRDGFLVKFDTTGNRIWGTYFGGANSDTIWDITLDTAGNVYIGGNTNSTAGIATTGAYQTFGSASFGKAFVSKFNPSGVMQWGTYYSGNFHSSLYSLDFDLNGNLLMGGMTNSTTGIATANTNQTTMVGSYDAFLAKINPAGTARIWGTYFGGNGVEVFRDVYVNPNNEIYVTGQTNSTTGLATTGAHQTTATSANNSTIIAAFSPYGGLPVTWKSFEANAYLENAQTKAILNWSTASESNNDYFTIERSFDAQAFEAIGKQKGAGNSNKLNRYSFIDESPFNKSMANTEVYYRIKQTDFDGKFENSPIKKLSLQETQQSPIKIFYQDNQAIINWGTTSPEYYQLELINLAGQIVLQTNINSANLFSQTPITYKGISGMYLLRIKGTTQEECFKILVE